MKKYTLILLRGLAREGRHWGEWVDVLRERPYAANVIFLDVPGTGNRLDVKVPWQLGAYVADLRSQLNAMTTSGMPSVLVGLSMGGMMAFDWFSRYPEEIHGCCLLNSSMATLAPFFWRLKVENYPKLVSAFASSGVEYREKMILSAVSNLYGTDPLQLANWVQIQEQAPVSRLSALQQLVAAACYRPVDELTADAAARLAVLCSRGDRLVDYRSSEAISRRYGCYLAMHETAGHDLPMDAPSWVLGELDRFVARLS